MSNIYISVDDEQVAAELYANEEFAVNALAGFGDRFAEDTSDVALKRWAKRGADGSLYHCSVPEFLRRLANAIEEANNE